MKAVLIAVAALVVGVVLGALSREPAIRRLQRQVRKLRSAVKTSGNPAVDGLSTHEKALYYKMLDVLENGEPRLTAQNRLTQKSIFRSVTKFLFITAQVFAIVWVSISYGIAIYSTIVLFQPFPVVELSQQAITTIIGAMALKVVENIFEHNEGLVFGRRPETVTPPEENVVEETEGMG